MSQAQTSLKIEVPRERAQELYKFTDLYLHSKRIMTIDEYQGLIRTWPESLIDIVFRDMCSVVFDLEEGEECPIGADKILEEIFNALESSEELERLSEELDVDWANIDPLDNDIHVDDKIEVMPVLKFEDGDYKIYLVVDRIKK